MASLSPQDHLGGGFPSHPHRSTYEDAARIPGHTACAGTARMGPPEPAPLARRTAPPGSCRLSSHLCRGEALKLTRTAALPAAVNKQSHGRVAARLAAPTLSRGSPQAGCEAGGAGPRSMEHSGLRPSAAPPPPCVLLGGATGAPPFPGCHIWKLQLAWGPGKFQRPTARPLCHGQRMGPPLSQSPDRELPQDPASGRSSDEDSNP